MTIRRAVTFLVLALALLASRSSQAYHLTNYYFWVYGAECRDGTKFIIFSTTEEGANKAAGEACEKHGGLVHVLPGDPQMFLAELATAMEAAQVMCGEGGDGSDVCYADDAACVGRVDEEISAGSSCESVVFGELLAAQLEL